MAFRKPELEISARSPLSLHHTGSKVRRGNACHRAAARTRGADDPTIKARAEMVPASNFKPDLGFNAPLKRE